LLTAAEPAPLEEESSAVQHAHPTLTT
jgi:hypothetical protein